MIDFFNDPIVRRELTLAVTFALQAGLALSFAVPVSLAIIQKLSQAVRR
jgi:hypothetical protein